MSKSTHIGVYEDAPGSSDGVTHPRAPRSPCGSGEITQVGIGETARRRWT